MYKNINILQQVFFWVINFILSIQCLRGQSFTIKGTVKGMDSGYVMLHYRDANNQQQNLIAWIRLGNFQFKGLIAKTDFVSLTTDTINYDKKHSISFFVQTGTTKIIFRYGKINEAIIKGSKVQREYARYLKSQSVDRAELKRLSSVDDSVRQLLKNGLIDAQKANDITRNITQELKPIFQSMMKKDLAYIQKFRGSYISLILLHSLVGRVSNDSIDYFYSLLSEKVKNSSLEYRFIDYLIRYRKATTEEYPFDKLRLGEKAPQFTIFSNVTGDTLRKQNFYGKTLILEFWSLYCFPCLKFNPTLEEIRKQYGKNKLEVIAVNINKDKEMQELIIYITKNRFKEWIHVAPEMKNIPVNTQIHNGDFSNYSGLGVPRTIVIDKNGNLVYKKYGYSPEELDNFHLLIERIVNEQ